MTWKIEFSETAFKQLKKIDKNAAKRIISFLTEKISEADNPRSIGKALSGHLGDFWRYRVGDYRIICDIQDKNIIILVLQIGNRKEIYRN